MPRKRSRVRVSSLAPFLCYNHKYNMNWIIFVIIAVIADSLRIFIDNYVSDVYFKGRHAVAQKLFDGLMFVIFGFIMLIATGFNPGEMGIVSALLIVLAGVLHSMAGIPYYRALELDDSTNIGIFTQLAPVFYLILGWFFLDQSFSPMQLVAFAVIILAPILIVMTSRKRSRSIKIKAVFFAFLYVLVSVIGNLIFVKVNTESMNFVFAIGIVLIGKGFSDMMIVASQPKLRKRFFDVNRRSKRRLLVPLVMSSITTTVQQFTYRAGLILAPAVAIASVSSDSAEPIVIFFMGLLLTLLWPKFGREKLQRKTIMVHLVATIMVVIGVVLLQM